MKRLFMSILFIMIFAFPVSVYADDIDFKFSAIASPTSIVDAAGDEAKIKIFVSSNNDQKITGCEFNMNASDGAEFVSLTGANGWTDDSGEKYSLKSVDGVTESTVIGNAVFKINSDSTITFSNIKCYSVENDSSGSQDDVKVSIKISDDVNVKIDGEAFFGSIYVIRPYTKESVLLSVTSPSSSRLNNVTVKVANTASGDKVICDSGSLSECTVNFTNSNFCINTNECTDLYGQVGDVIKVIIDDNGDTSNFFFISRELSESDFYTDSSIKSLKVFGNEITLVEGQSVYEVTVAKGLEEYSVEAELSDPEHYTWGEDSNPSIYNFATDTVYLLVKPIDDKTLGARERLYTIHVKYEGDSSEASDNSIPSESTQPPASTARPNNGGTNNNPKTGAATLVISIIMFISLIVTLRYYRNSVE